MSSAHEIELLFYSAPGCCLCETALSQLEPLARELGFRVSEVDISANAELEALYRARIPVAELRGRVVFKYRMDEKRLRRLVEEAREAG